MSELTKRRLINAQIKWAEKSGRHEDMLNNVRALIKEASAQGFELSPDERNFVSFAYKNVVSELRQQWRTLVQTELKWLDGDTENGSGENGEENEEKSGQSTARSRQSSARSNYSSNMEDDEDEIDYFEIDDETMIKKKWDPRNEQQMQHDNFHEFLKSIEKKLFDICAELEVTINETLLPATGENQGKV